MIPLETRNKLLAELPDAYQITIDGQTYQRDINYWWADEDREPTYPSVELRLGVTGQQRDNQPLGQRLRRLAVEDDDTIAENRLKGERLYDEVSVRIATEGQIMDTSADERAHILTQQLAHFCRFELTDAMIDPDTVGTKSNELSLRADVVEGPSYITGMVNEITVPTWQFQIRLSYTATHDVLIDAVDRLEIDYEFTF